MEGNNLILDGIYIDDLQKDDKRTGWGMHIWPDGHYYEGEYDDDKRNGKGIFKVFIYATVCLYYYYYL
jgi:hypothetical protein